MALLALIIILYTRVCVVRPFICMNCVRVYTIERAYARAYICACTCIRVSLRLFTRKNANAVSYVHLRAFACVHLRVCLCTDLIKKRKTHLRAKYFNTQTHFGFRNFQDVLYIALHTCDLWLVP